jgi:NAD(P)-dependent dehydrogenase (short-subunit alcohol dehydrogenase family)
VIEATERRFGGLDVMVANAGIGSCAELSKRRWPIGADKPR